MMIGDVNRLSATEPFPSIGFQIITLIGIIAVSFGVQMFLSRPELGAMALGVIPSPELLHNRDMLYVAIGILGATVMPHNLYLHSSIVQTRHYKLTPEGKREAIFFGTIDSTVALFFALFINAAILIVAAATFYKTGHHEVAEIQDAYKLLNLTRCSALPGRVPFLPWLFWLPDRIPLRRGRSRAKWSWKAFCASGYLPFFGALLPGCSRSCPPSS